MLVGEPMPGDNARVIVTVDSLAALARDRVLVGAWMRAASRCLRQPSETP